MHEKKELRLYRVCNRLDRPFGSEQQQRKRARLKHTQHIQMHTHTRTPIYAPLVFAQLLVVGADVDDAGENASRVETRGGDVEVELANGNAHAVHAQVSQPQNPRPVCYHDRIHLR